MKWYNDMSEQEKRSFQKVIAVCVVGAISGRCWTIILSVAYR